VEDAWKIFYLTREVQIQRKEIACSLDSQILVSLLHSKVFFKHGMLYASCMQKFTLLAVALLALYLESVFSPTYGVAFMCSGPRNPLIAYRKNAA
jgi:hypothetical protein